MRAFLTALELLQPDGWAHDIEHALCKASAAVRYLGFRGRLIVWAPRRVRAIRKDLSFADGFEISRLWLGPGKPALSVRPRRLYFIAGSEEPERRPEHLILDTSQRPPSPAGASQLTSILDLLNLLNAASQGVVGDLVELATPVTGADSEVHLGVGEREVVAPRVSLNQLYRDAGFDRVPTSFRVNLLACPGVSDIQVQEVASALRRTMKDRKIEPSVVILERSAIEERLERLDQGAKRIDRAAQVVHLVLPDQSEPISRRSANIMAALDRHHVPWRRSYADDDLRFSIPDQLPSLLQAARGRPHRIHPVAGLDAVWSIGVDLSHGRLEQKSRLCVSLIDPEGALEGAWTCSQRRDETPGREQLQGMLRAAGDRARKTDRNPRFLIVRDGRLFENERFQDYTESLGRDATLIECRKNGNPPLFFGSPGDPKPPDAASWASVPGRDIIFLVTNPMREKRGMDRVLKVTWKSSWNGLHLEAAEIAQLLVGLSFSPGLGLQRRTLPAPLYWADGIAGADDSDLRFRGQPVVAYE